jgi:hypothetical protein
VTAGSTLQSTSLLGCRQRPRNERLRAIHAAPPLSRTRPGRTWRSSSRIMALRARGAHSREAASGCGNWQAVVRNPTSCKVSDVSALFRHPTEPQPAAFILPSCGRVPCSPWPHPSNVRQRPKFHEEGLRDSLGPPLRPSRHKQTVDACLACFRHCSCSGRQVCFLSGRQAGDDIRIKARHCYPDPAK